MRTKAFVMSMGLAASVWLTGCQSNSSSRLGLYGEEKSRTSKSCRKSAESETVRTAKTDKSSGRIPPTAVAAAPCATCAKNAAVQPAAHVHGGEQVVQAAGTCSTCSKCATCGASTGNTVPQAIGAPPAALSALPPGQVIVVPGPGQAYTIPSQSYAMPNPPMVPPNQAGASIADAGSTGLPQVGANYGPGVEAVTSQQPIELPTTLPGQQPASNTVMTVRFGQANNYQVVVGQVSQFRRGWKLRYAALESEDKYGGSLSLIGDNLENLKDGQMVRVEGIVLPSEDRSSSPRYQVHRVEVIEPDVK